MALEATAGFEYRGMNHVALVCKDLDATVRFYRDLLEMPIIKWLELPDDKGQHVFFDSGAGSSIAFFCFPGAPPVQPGVVQAPRGGGRSAHGSMNHLAISVPLEKLEAYRARLARRGVEVTEVVDHRESGDDGSDQPVFIRSIYFHDPDGIRLEFAAWTDVPVVTPPARHPASVAEPVR